MGNSWTSVLWAIIISEEERPVLPMFDGILGYYVPEQEQSGLPSFSIGYIVDDFLRELLQGVFH
jgi:hypothetical protein